MEEDYLKILTGIVGGDFANLSPEAKKQAFDLLKGVAPSNAPTPATIKNPELQAKKDDFESALIDKAKKGLTGEDSRLAKLEKGEAMKARLVDAAPRRMIQSTTQPNDPYESRIRNMVNKELGITDAFSERRSEFDLNRLDAKAAAIGKTRDEYETMPRLERMKLESAGAVAEQERRKGVRDSVALPFNSQFLKDKEKLEAPFKQQGLPAPGADRTGYEEGNRNIFKDAQGRIEDPATLKARLIKEGVNPNDATLAAGQRSRDMFNPPNAKKEGFGMEGGQRAAVLDADPGLRPDGTSPRMSVMEQLKDARENNLQALAEARRNDPFRKEVGTVTKVEAPDGTVLAQRGEGEVRADRAGNTVDAPGRMNYLNGAANLKDALTTYNNADVAKRPNVPLYYEGTNEPVSVDGKQRFTTAPAPTVSKELNGLSTKVSGPYGAAVGGVAIGTNLTKEQRLGLAPLPPETQKARDALVGGPTLPQGMEMKDGKLRAYEKDPIKEQLAKSNSQEGRDLAADAELVKRRAAKKRA